MSKKSGLADSPFFKPDTPQKQPPASPPQDGHVRVEEIVEATESQSSAVTESGTAEVANSETAEVGNSRTAEVANSETAGVANPSMTVTWQLRRYELRNFDQFRRLDVRLTAEQKRFLDNWEEDIRQAMPEGERRNPTYKRITKNSIMRVLVEIFRQLEIPVDATHFRNEQDLMQTLFDGLCQKVAALRSPEVTESHTSEVAQFGS